MKPLLTIIIQTRNHEWQLRRLLKSIQEQASWIEVIVVDTGSIDHTKEVVKEYGAKILEGKKKIAYTLGGFAATAEVLLFLSPYVILPASFLKDALAEFKQRRLETAVTYTAVRSANPFDHLLQNYARNTWYFFTHAFVKQASCFCFFATKHYFEKKNGFDKNLIDGAADAFVKGSKYGLLQSQSIVIDTSYLSEEGRLRFYWKSFYLFVYRLFFGEFKRREFLYPKS